LQFSHKKRYFMTKSSISFYCIEKELEYCDKLNKIKTGIVIECEIKINKYFKSILYTVRNDLDNLIYVDGDTFREI
jgi:hypothetical protein